MALKDWKKHSWYEYENKRTGLIIFIDNPKISFIKDYIFVYPSDKRIKHFKTKSQALKFAKSYMRKH